MSKVTVNEINNFFETHFGGRAELVPQTREVGDGTCTVRMITTKDHLRPGGSIGGPSQMALADHAAYITIFTQIGLTPMAVTSNLSINFLRPCFGEHLDAKANLMKFGRSLAVVEVSLFGSASDKPASHAMVTYALPQKRDT